MSAGEPRADSKGIGDDLLGPLMILTTTTGVIDAISFVGLGHVFTANMTGNVVFIGFALGGAHELSIHRSLAAFAAFATGVLAALEASSCDCSRKPGSVHARLPAIRARRRSCLASHGFPEIWPDQKH